MKVLHIETEIQGLPDDVTWDHPAIKSFSVAIADLAHGFLWPDEWPCDAGTSGRLLSQETVYSEERT